MTETNNTGNLNKNGERIFILEPFNRGVSDKEIINDVKNVINALGKKTCTYEAYRKHGGRFSDFIMRKRFGSWNGTLSEAGIEIRRKMNIPDEQLFDNLENVWIKLGRQPRREEMRKPLSSYYHGTYERRFGTWRKALEEFVNYVNHEAEEKPYPSISVSHTSKRIERQPNLRLRFRVMRRDDFKCQICGRSPATHSGIELHIDHIIPWSEGGETVLENLQTLCAECNLGKSNLIC